MDKKRNKTRTLQLKAARRAKAMLRDALSQVTQISPEVQKTTCGGKK